VKIEGAFLNFTAIPMAMYIVSHGSTNFESKIDFYGRLRVQEKQTLKEIDAPVRALLLI
jgi:hypothetical protein